MTVFTLEVTVHLTRPFSTSQQRTMWTHVDVPDSGDDTKDLLQARLTAYWLADAHPAVAQVAAVNLLYVEV